MFSFINVVSVFEGEALKHEARGRGEETPCPLVTGFCAGTRGAGGSGEAASPGSLAVSQLLCRTAHCLAAKILGLKAAGRNAQRGGEPAWSSQRENGPVGVPGGARPPPGPQGSREAGVLWGPRLVQVPSGAGD